MRAMQSTKAPSTMRGLILKRCLLRSIREYSVTSGWRSRLRLTGCALCTAIYTNWRMTNLITGICFVEQLKPAIVHLSRLVLSYCEPTVISPASCIDSGIVRLSWSSGGHTKGLSQWWAKIRLFVSPVGKQNEKGGAVPLLPLFNIAGTFAFNSNHKQSWICTTGSRMNLSRSWCGPIYKADGFNVPHVTAFIRICIKYLRRSYPGYYS